MEQLQIFKNAEFGAIRAVTINNEAWFCLKDICEALGLNQISRVKSRLKEDGVTTSKVIDNLGRTQQANFVNESNLYKVIFQSRKESAERFTDWVTSEVLPSIRKNGGYIANQENLTDDELMAKALLVAQNKIRRTKKMNKIREEIENNLFDMESIIELMTLPQYQESEILHRRYEELKLDIERLNRELRKTA